jgi:hypothetical protein
MPNTRNLAFLSVLALSVGGTAQTSGRAASGAPTKQRFDGAWWLSANLGERSGFINGIADCMTWEAHKNGYSATPEQIADKITQLYESEGTTEVGILEAWQRVSHAEKRSPTSKDEETWANPHWYLNGDWWIQEAQTEQLGFVEGYLWCNRTQMNEKHGSYSKTDGFYWNSINSFIAANPKLGKEAVAITLARFEDRGTPGSEIHPH